MSRLIDADAFEVVAYKGIPKGYNDTFGDGVDWILEKIDRMPTIEPELIRCKDCKWWSNDEYRECLNPNYDKVWNTPRGFYCGFAERRTDE